MCMERAIFPEKCDICINKNEKLSDCQYVSIKFLAKAQSALARNKILLLHQQPLPYWQYLYYHGFVYDSLFLIHCDNEELTIRISLMVSF